MPSIISSVGRLRFILWGVHSTLSMGAHEVDTPKAHSLIGVCENRQDALNLAALHFNNYTHLFVESVRVEEMTEPRKGGLVV